MFVVVRGKEGRMRKTTLALLSLLFVLVAAIPAYATNCSAGTSGSGGGVSWTDYSAENLTEQKSTWDCWSMSGLSATTLSAFSLPGFEMRALSGNATRVFTVPTGAGGHYSVQMDVQLYSPDVTWYDQINATVTVYHPGTNTSTPYTLYYLNGGQGNDSGSVPYVDFYNVAVGDTITISIQGAWSFNSNAHAQFTNVHIFNLTP
jgi:hypothetical protein